MRRFRQPAQVALHCLRILLHVCVAVPTLGQVQRRSLLPLSQLCCVELVWKQFALAVAALVQALLPCLFLSISDTIWQLSPTSGAFRFFVISLFLLLILRRSASNAWHGSFLRQPTHSTSAFSSEGFVQQALHFASLVRLQLLLHVLRRAASNASHGSFWRQLTHSTSASSWEGRPPSTPCALPRMPEATLHYSILLYSRGE